MDCPVAPRACKPPLPGQSVVFTLLPFEVHHCLGAMRSPHLADSLARHTRIVAVQPARVGANDELVRVVVTNAQRRDGCVVLVVFSICRLRRAEVLSVSAGRMRPLTHNLTCPSCPPVMTTFAAPGVLDARMTLTERVCPPPTSRSSLPRSTSKIIQLTLGVAVKILFSRSARQPSFTVKLTPNTPVNVVHALAWPPRRTPEVDDFVDTHTAWSAPKRREVGQCRRRNPIVGRIGYLEHT